jgi:uncharacterized RDD family membrane protein YckC
MKCPKCEYLGFETGDRCKNCGYDFSLTPAPPTPSDLEPELFLRPLDSASADPPTWDGVFDRARSEPMSVAAATMARAEEKLPLFSPAVDDSDEPLIRLPAAPRAPLAVRRTPDISRLRAVPKPVARVDTEPVLEFAEAAPVVPAPAVVEPIADVRARSVAKLAAHPASLEPSSPARRLAAVAIDHVVLGAIDLSVIYLTVRMADLPMSGWVELPLAPLVVFLMVVKLAYFCVFTAVGGQTIGKMAMRIRVVTAENRPLAAAGAALRSLAGTLSAITLGLGYVPALFGSARSTLHDRLTHTRVVSLPPA